jgi:hypothetical protein
VAIELGTNGHAPPRGRSWSGAPGRVSEEVRMTELLDRLVGFWDLHGELGASTLHQAVEARSVLGGRYVELRFRELDGSPYEAVYYVGWNEERDVYVLHLLDSTGVYVEPEETVAIGRREEHAITFSFGDAAEPFTNRFEWDADDDAWTFELTFARDGKPSTFATKRMTREERRRDDLGELRG